jgi:hypothetical protein|tara:strand:- start:7279 stop:7497 length:219 start_codon:yes stop_codon:yes gene_type:complete
MLSPETIKQIKKELGPNSVFFAAKLQTNGTTTQMMTVQDLRGEFVSSLLFHQVFELHHKIYNSKTGFEKQQE